MKFVDVIIDGDFPSWKVVRYLNESGILGVKQVKNTNGAFYDSDEYILIHDSIDNSGDYHIYYDDIGQIFNVDSGLITYTASFGEYIITLRGNNAMYFNGKTKESHSITALDGIPTKDKGIISKQEPIYFPTKCVNVKIADDMLLSWKKVWKYDSTTRTLIMNEWEDFYVPDRFLTMTRLGDGTLLYVSVPEWDSSKTKNTFQSVRGLRTGTFTITDWTSTISAPSHNQTICYLGNNIYQTDFLQSAELYDVLGICVCKYNNTNMIDISEFARGIYFLKTKDYSIKLFKY
jgi:hypothetical protein